jgi:hypothetical protein
MIIEGVILCTSILQQEIGIFIYYCFYQCGLMIGRINYFFFAGQLLDRLFSVLYILVFSDKYTSCLLCTNNNV